MVGVVFEKTSEREDDHDLGTMIRKPTFMVNTVATINHRDYDERSMDLVNSYELRS